MIALRDVSERARFGCKGPNAARWLTAQGFPLPMAANSWIADGHGVVVARLATSEFLVEAFGPGASAAVGASDPTLQPARRTAGVYGVLRQDLVLEFGGDAHDLLREICSVDFRPYLREAAGVASADRGPVVLTSMIGVGVTVLPRLVAGVPSYTLWCDPTFAHYFRSTLENINDRGAAAPGEHRQ
jgi:sarcosine oxidase subunit gamma